MSRTPISRRALLAGLGGGALALGATSGSTPLVFARPFSRADDPTVITDWNAITVATIVTDAGKANAEAFVWLAFTQAAVYNAVVGITRRYTLYQWNELGPKSASPVAAAATAARHILLTYFGHLPAARARVETAYAASLAAIGDGVGTRRGIAYGERAAAHVVALRANDGREAPVTFDLPPAPGVWRPTPPAHAPMFAPWLGRMTPLTLTAASQFRPGPPPALTSAQYTQEFNEVKAVGGKTSALRTAAQTEIARYMAPVPIVPLRAALRELVVRRGLDISDSARLFAAADLSMADGIIACWDCKLEVGLWRPSTAIQRADEDGNPATEADPTWEPLIVDPPYPDYPSGLTAVVGAFSRALTRVFGTSRIDVSITVPALGLTRHYEHAADLNAEAVDARVWSGIHFRTADEVGIDVGTRVADWALDHNFFPR